MKRTIEMSSDDFRVNLEDALMMSDDVAQKNEAALRDQGYAPTIRAFALNGGSLDMLAWSEIPGKVRIGDQIAPIFFTTESGVVMRGIAAWRLVNTPEGETVVE